MRNSAVIATSIVFSILLLAAWIAAPALYHFVDIMLYSGVMNFLREGDYMAKAGQLGDSYGGATSLFTLLGFIAVIATIVFESQRRRDDAMRQSNATNASAFTSVHGILQAPQTISARGHVIRVLRNKPFDDWTGDDKKKADEVCRTYDLVGVMSSSGMFSEDVILDAWGNSIYLCWGPLANRVEEQRKIRKDLTFQKHFKRLGEAAVERHRLISSQEALEHFT